MCLLPNCNHHRNGIHAQQRAGCNPLGPACLFNWQGLWLVMFKPTWRNLHLICRQRLTTSLKVRFFMTQTSLPGRMITSEITTPLVVPDGFTIGVTRALPMKQPMSQKSTADSTVLSAQELKIRRRGDAVIATAVTVGAERTQLQRPDPHARYRRPHRHLQATHGPAQ